MQREQNCKWREAGVQHAGTKHLLLWREVIVAAVVGLQQGTGKAFQQLLL